MNNSLVIPNNTNKNNDDIQQIVLEKQTLDNMLSNLKPDHPNVLEQLLNNIGKNSELTIKIRHKQLNQKQPKENNKIECDDIAELKKHYPEYESFPTWQASIIGILIMILLVVVVSK